MNRLSFCRTFYTYNNIHWAGIKDEYEIVIFKGYYVKVKLNQ